MGIKSYDIKSTYYSDGNRQVTVTWDCDEGDWHDLGKLTQLIKEYLEHENYKSRGEL